MKNFADVVFKEPHYKIFTADEIDDVFTPLMKYINEELLPRDYVIIDIGFSIPRRNESDVVKPSSWVIFDYNPTKVRSPGKSLGLLLKTLEDYQACSTYIEPKIQGFGSSFFRHIVILKKEKQSPMLVAIWYWEDLFKPKSVDFKVLT